MWACLPANTVCDLNFWYFPVFWMKNGFWYAQEDLHQKVYSTLTHNSKNYLYQFKKGCESHKLPEGHSVQCPPQRGLWRPVDKGVSLQGQDKGSPRPVDPENHPKSRARGFWAGWPANTLFCQLACPLYPSSVEYGTGYGPVTALRLLVPVFWKMLTHLSYFFLITVYWVNSTP